MDGFIDLLGQDNAAILISGLIVLASIIVIGVGLWMVSKWSAVGVKQAAQALDKDETDSEKNEASLIGATYLLAQVTANSSEALKVQTEALQKLLIGVAQIQQVQGTQVEQLAAIDQHIVDSQAAVLAGLHKTDLTLETHEGNAAGRSKAQLTQIGEVKHAVETIPPAIDHLKKLMGQSIEIAERIEGMLQELGGDGWAALKGQLRGDWQRDIHEIKTAFEERFKKLEAVATAGNGDKPQDPPAPVEHNPALFLTAPDFVIKDAKDGPSPMPQPVEGPQVIQGE